MRPLVKFSISIPGADRLHYVNEDGVRTVLSRLPVELWCRVHAVHFNDRSRGARVLGYVNRGRREIALCALPPRVSLTRSLVKGQTAERFGAKRGHQWPKLAVRRFMLYDVLLHELGHLQTVSEKARSIRPKFAHEKLAQSFAQQWCARLWSEPLVHVDSVHNPPTSEELASLP